MRRTICRRLLLGILLLAVAAGVAAGLAFRRDLADARARIESRSRIADTRCGAIEYAETGEGPAVLFVHGAGGGFDQGLRAGGQLARRGFRVIAVSRFGYLRTPLPANASAEAQADAHACLLDALGVSRAAVIGASAGAPSSLQLALRHPGRVRALVLLVPASYAPHGSGEASLATPAETPWLFDSALRSDFLFWAAMQVARPVMLRGLLATPPDLVDAADAAERARVHALLSDILPVRARRLGLLNDAVVTSTLSPYPLQRIRAPTLAIAAEDDGFGTDDSARHAAAVIPNARLLLYPTGGHVLVGRDAATTEAIARFLHEALLQARTSPAGQAIQNTSRDPASPGW